ncbi:hypothetical protein A0H81_04469 [Grifola frondosa]|uniref:Uncharacterized protein n=1 Tax=Grifola frondosa TaxID=5627 RepID=A0A1C7MGI9_GRIFR|nr:hypothetical protein A0H81_04469 [Grifola frondosa]
MDCTGSIRDRLHAPGVEMGMLTKYSDVLPDGSFTPPPKIVVEVLWICGVLVRVFELVEAPDLRTMVPRNQPPTLLRLDMMEIEL